jgi:stress response protein YsnF
MEVENAQRPNYSVYLNAQGISQDTEGNMPEFQGGDTMIGAGPSRVEGFERNAMYQQPNYNFAEGSHDEFLRNQRVYNNALRRKFQRARFAGCGQY